ncbi:Glycoside hydrolase superfamily [Penicillium malachiteum]|uniref:Glycoside hydrolase superfamily n=1 Tax=Penicillium malachiteum TaxID=1324776 RepID=UPI002548C5B0|nr:Glycoside hydrolase superfamily [Penicillium malachiteum]KAJ5713893.1 Glycoside hydrolase superfamily [Penicillium malachiteum]
MFLGVPFTLLLYIGLLPSVIADITCSAIVPCAIGCCGEYGVCGMGPDYCGADVCINNCDAKAECNPGGWASEYVNATICPLDVCCSQYGFCGRTEEFCGNKAVTAPSCDGMAPYSVPQGVYSHIYFAFGSIDPDTFKVIPAETTTFSDLAAADTSTQTTFFKSLINFISTYGFTGVDIDWEYPVASDRNSRAEDFKNYPTFLASLKKALSDYKYSLSITLPTSYWYLQNFDLTAIEPSVDWFNVMSYNLYEPGCQYLSAGTMGNCSQSVGILFNSKIEALISDQNLTSTLYKDAAVKTVTWDGDQWVSYDDEETWKLKADYAKFVCIRGVMVWSIDKDDDMHSYSNGLAATLRNTVNLNSSDTASTGLVVDTVETTTEYRQDNYCRFINCGETCPSGFSEITREDNKKQLMLDSAECVTGSKQTQTLCCPTLSTLPTCQWRGFNGGKCKGGCDSGEAEVGTNTAGCRSGYQSACCTIVDSIEPWSECAWISACESDDTCPSGYDKFVVGSRQGWGGRKKCSGSKNYNYCCKTSIPDAFTNCAWTGRELQGTSSIYCSDACPSGAIRIVEESFSISTTSVPLTNPDAKTAGCVYGNEAYCCNGTAKVVNTQSSSDELTGIVYKFDFYLKKWLANPTCSASDNEYVATFGRRDLYERASLSTSKSTNDQYLLFTMLVGYVVTWLTSSSPDPALTKIWTDDMSAAGYAAEAANLTIMRDLTYGYGDPWTGTPVYPANTMVSQMLCDIAESQAGIESLAVANDILYELPLSSSISKRMLDGISDNARSANRLRPTILTVLNGINSGDLTFHYGRWVSTDTLRDGVPEVILELAFWIGPTPGVAPTPENLSTYGDSEDTIQTDRWVAIHIHIPRDGNTFQSNTTEARGVFPRISAIGVGNANSGSIQNYNARAQALSCVPGRRWAIGIDSTADLQYAKNHQLPVVYAQALNDFGIWLAREGILLNSRLGLIWHQVGGMVPEDGPGWNVIPPRGNTGYSPTSNTFTVNWDSAGNTVNIRGSTSSYT